MKISALNRTFSVAHSQWDIFNGTFSIGRSQWDIFNGTFSMGHLQWDVLNGTSSMGRSQWDVLNGTSSMGHLQWDVLNGTSFPKEVHTTCNINMFQALVSMTSISTPHLQDRPKKFSGKIIHYIEDTSSKVLV